MLPYVLLMFLPAIFPLIAYRPTVFTSVEGYEEMTEKRNKMTLGLFFFFFFVLLALRDIAVGSDLITYKTIFQNTANTSFGDLSGSQWELGYIAYNKLISFISKNYRIFLMITSAVILLPIYKLYSKEKRYTYLLIVLFMNMPCFLIVFSGIRQAVAISIGALVYIAIDKKKYILSLLLILIAISFHMSAIVLFLMYPALLLRIKAKHLRYIVPAMLVIYLFRLRIFSFVLSFMPSRYVQFYGDVQETGAIGTLLLFLIFFVFSFVILDETEMTQRDFFMRNVLLIATVFQFFVPVHGLVQRASYYFLIFVPISIICVVKAPKRYLKNISDLAIIVLGCFFTVYFFGHAMFSTDNLLDVFPYRFFWSGQGW